MFERVGFGVGSVGLTLGFEFLEFWCMKSRLGWCLPPVW